MHLRGKIDRRPGLEGRRPPSRMRTAGEGPGIACREGQGQRRLLQIGRDVRHVHVCIPRIPKQVGIGCPETVRPSGARILGKGVIGIIILESHRGGGLPGIRAFDGVIGVYELGQAAGAPAIVTGIQDVRCPDELQIKACGVYVNMAKRIVARGWDGVGKRTGLIF